MLHKNVLLKNNFPSEKHNNFVYS